MKVNQHLNHTTSHLLAAAVLKLYPDVQIGFGPAIDEGFYYDFKFSEAITDFDLKKIEKQMKKMAAGGYKVKKVDKVDLSTQIYKQELIKELKAKGETITYYGLINPANGKSAFTDLCAGGHIDSVAKIKHFKLLTLAGAYWRGDSNRDQLTRIYGTCWETAEELNNYLALLEERKARDHRKIGKEMNIFMFHELAGQGFPIWLEDGMVVKNAIQSYVRKTEKRYGFKEVQTPSFGAIELYEKSGHWAHYKDDMYDPIEAGNEKLVMRPMTCPHHILIYNSKRRSYRELPIRMSEQARLFRYEKSGALTGLERVRAMELTEGHIFCRVDQIVEEFKNSYQLIKEVLKKFDIKIDYVSLSLRDVEKKDKYFDDSAVWEEAENALRKVLKELKIDYVEKIGEAAFYGPKVDIQVKSILGHEITLSTLQLDFILPKRFESYYINENKEKITPVLIHRGLIGTYERFMSILIEQTKGNFPFWCSPRQATIIPINNEHHAKYALKVKKTLEAAGLEVFYDDRNEKLAKKIREAQISKTKFQIVIGDEEISNKTINIRAYGSEEQETITVARFLKKVAAL